MWTDVYLGVDNFLCKPHDADQNAGGSVVYIVPVRMITFPLAIQTGTIQYRCSTYLTLTLITGYIRVPRSSGPFIFAGNSTGTHETITL
jgi:hypothetical protein